jgi:regulator of protease activity HflC (stomatin/prohibitin superfamily)
LRATLGKHELDQLLAEREKINQSLQQLLDVQTDSWGVKVSNAEIKHVDLNESMVRAIAKQAEAERERRAKIIHAESELQASDKLQEAALMLAKAQQAIKLRGRRRRFTGAYVCTRMPSTRGRNGSMRRAALAAAVPFDADQRQQLLIRIKRLQRQRSKFGLCVD